MSAVEKFANRFSQEFIEKTRLKTQDGNDSFRTLADSSITTAVVEGATSITLATDPGYPSSGSLLLDNDPYTYTDITSSVVTLSALNRAFDAGDRVQIGYAVPTNFGKPRSLTLNGSKYILQKWGVQEKVAVRHYSVLNDFIYLPIAITGVQDVTLRFYKKATNVLTTSISMEIFDMWDTYVIYRLTARGHRLLYDPAAANDYEILAREILRSAKAQVATEDDSIFSAFQPGW